MALKKPASEKETPLLPKHAEDPKKIAECCKGTLTSSSASQQNIKGPKTRIVVKYDVGFNNYLTLRGTGPNLSWEKGIKLKNTKPDEWVWETDTPFAAGEFKVLINDQQYELGNNHALTCGTSIQYKPSF